MFNNMSETVNYMVYSSNEIDLGKDSADESELGSDWKFEIEENRPSQVETPDEMVSDDIAIDKKFYSSHSK